MGTYVKSFILCYLLFYPHYVFAFDHVTIVNADTIDKEFDTNAYQKNLFQPTSYLNAGYDTLYEHVGTVYQNVHTHYLIVGMKIPTHKDIPEPPHNGTKSCSFASNFKLMAWRNSANAQCHFFNGLFNQIEQDASHLYTKVFQVLHPEILTLLPNQGIKFLSETEHPLKEAEEETDEATNKTCSKRSADKILLMTEKHREKRFISALIKGLCRVTRGASIFGRLISSVKKIGGYIFKGVHGLFHHHKVQAIYRAVNTFKKYHSKMKIGQLYRYKVYHDLHISKVSLYDKLNKALRKFGKHMTHKAFLHYLHNTDNTTWYYEGYDDLKSNWRKGFESFFLTH